MNLEVATLPSKLVKIPPGTQRRVGALVDSDLYNEVVSFTQAMDVDASWIVRKALTDFVARHRLEASTDPKQLALDLGLGATGRQRESRE